MVPIPSKSSSNRKKRKSRKGIEFQRLEDRILYSAAPAVQVDAPAEVNLGESAHVKITFDNADATDTGYGPWVDVFIDHTGADGIVDLANPSNPHIGDTDQIANPGDQYDGISFATGAPQYLGTDVIHQTFTLDDSANGGKGILHPYAKDSTGHGVYVSTTDASSPYFTLLNGTFTSGDQVMVLQLPYGSFSPDQPAAEITFDLLTSDYADLGQPLTIKAVGGFQFGNDPLNNPQTDPSIIGNADSASFNVSTQLAILTKDYFGPENETATGPNYTRTYRINIDVADGQTLTDLHIFDDLDPHLQFKQISGASQAYTLIDTPSTSVPGGQLALAFDAPVLGTVAGDDAWVDIEFYVPRVFDSNLNGTIDAGDNSVLDPCSGADFLVDNQAYGFGSWHPLDPRDGDTIIGLQVDGSFNNTDLATALATAAPDASPEHHNLEVSPLVVQKDVHIFTDNGLAGYTPGDVLEYTLDFQVSDYYALSNLVIDDHMLDGLRFDSSFVPTLEINGNTFLLTSLGWTAANYTVSQNFTGAVASGNLVIDPAANDGSTGLQFRISDEMVTRGENGNFIGGGIDPTAPTGDIANALSGYNDGPTTGRITYHATIEDAFTDIYPSGEASLNPRDALSNSVTITGDVLDLDSGVALLPCISGATTSDDSGTSFTIVTQEVHKTIYAINGNTNLSAYIDTEGNVNLQPGDVVTYRFGYTIPSGDVENLRLTDFLPQPVFDVDDINADGTANGLGEFVFVDNTANVAVTDFTSGHITYGPLHTLNTVTSPAAATPTVAIDSTTNSVLLQWGDFVNTTNDFKTVDVLISVTVNNTPFADGLFLTNQVQSGEGNTQSVGSESTSNAIVQIVLNQPNVGIYKGVVASSQGGSVGLVGGLTFDPIGGPGNFSGTLSDPANAAAIGALNLDASTDVDGGDVVRFALVAFNQGRSDAYDVKFEDTLRGSYVNNYADKAAFVAGTNFQVLRGDGTALVEGVDYDLTWNAGTQTFQVELTDNYTAGNQGGDIKDGGLSRGYSPSVDANITNGSNAVVVLYDLTVDTDAQSSSTITNTATLTNYANDDAAEDHTTENPIDSASVVIASPEFSKVFVTTSVLPAQDPNNAANQAVIGELVTYTLTITATEGTTLGAMVVDTMDAGLSFVNIVSTTYSGGLTSVHTIGTGANPTNVTIGNAAGGTANLLTFDFGDLTNTDTNNAVVETITITYQAVVNNNNTVPGPDGNQAGDDLTNSADLSWSWVNDPDDPVLPNPEGTRTLTVTADTVEVIEPVLTIDKQASANNIAYVNSLSGVDAGDVVFYRIRISNASGNAIAYDIDVADVLPGFLGSLSVVSTTLTNASGGVGGSLSVTDGGLNALDVADFAITGSTLSLASGVNMDLGANSRLEIIVQGTLDYSLVPEQVVPNTASVTWTSLDGSSGAASVHNPASVERTGADGPGADGTVLNNYSTADGADVTITPTLNVKTIVNTSEDFTTTVGGTERVAVGEIIRYRLTIRLPEGSFPDGQIVDALPNGLLFINDGTATIGFVSDNPTSIVSSTLGTTPYLGTTITTPTFVLPDIAVSISATADNDDYNSGTDVRFKVGNLQNLEDDAGAEYIVIEFNALVLNTASAGNQSNTQLRNTFETFINGTQKVGLTSNNVDARVAEPNLAVTKTASTTGPIDAGDTFSYTITIKNDASGSNAAAAFDIHLRDALDAITAANPTAELEFLSYSTGTLPVGTTILADASSTGTDILDLTFNRLNPGDTITVTVNAQVKAGALAAAEIENHAVVTYTSLPGTAGTTDGAIALIYGTTDVDLNPGTDSTMASALAGTTVSGVTLTTLTLNATERTGADSEALANDNTPPANNNVRNNYAVAANAPVNLLVASPTLDKTFQDGTISPDDTSVASSSGANVVIGETVTYDILVTLPEGITTNLRVEDLVPAGLRLDSMQVLTVAGSSTLLTADFNGSFATTPTLGASVSGANTVSFDFDDVTVVADNVAGNNSFVLRLVATVTNILPNQETVQRTNTARLVYNDPDAASNAGPAGDRTVTDANPGNDPTVTIVEPTLTIAKTVSSGVLDAGDQVTYTITIANASGQAAYDVLLSDILDPDLTTPTITSLVATGFSGGTFATPTLADFEFTVGGVLRVVPSFDLDMNDGSQIVITFTSILDADVTIGQVITNKSDVAWTSTDGVNSDERDGSGDPNPDATIPDAAILNNYAVSSQVTSVAVPEVVVSHSIFDTSHAGTTGNDATIGEVVTYRVAVTLPEGVTPNLAVDVNLPAGMAYIPGTIVLVAAHPDETSLNDAHGGNGTAAFNGTGLSAPTASRVAGPGNFTNGDDVRFTFANPITATGDNNVSNNTFYFTYQALVLDVPTNDGLAPGLTTLTPTGTWTAGTTSGAALVDTNNVANPLARGLTATVVEPELNIIKTASITAGDAGDPFTYTLTIDHTVASQANAYNLNLDDVLPGAFVPVSFTATIGASDVSANFLLTANTFSTDADGVDLLLGDTLTIVFTGNIRSTQAPGEGFTNSASLGYNTLPDGFTAQHGNLIDDADGVTNGTDRERQTFDTSHVDITVPSALGINKSLLSSSEAETSGLNFAIGESGTFHLAVTLQEGLTRLVTVNDTLPAGMVLESSSLVFRAVTAGTTAIGAVSNIVYTEGSTIAAADLAYNPITGVMVVSLKDVQIPVTASSGTGQFAVDYKADVLNVVANQNGSTLTNAANVQADRNGDGDTGDAGETSADSSVTLTLVEPDLVIDKTITTSTTGIDAGDTVTYQIVVSHSGSSSSNAYELILDDVLPASALQGFTLVSAVISDGATTTNVSGSFVLSGAGVLSTTGDIDLLLNTNGTNDQALTITISTTVKDDLTVGTSFANTATVKWSGLQSGLDGAADGTTGTPGNPGERTGGGNNPPNDYFTSDTVTATTVGVLDVAKGVDKPTATIGEIVTYTVTVTVAEGRTVIDLADTLPTGVTLVANSAALATPSGWTINGFDANSASQTLTVSNPGGSGSTTNDSSTADTDVFTYTYQVVVTNVFSNQSGVTLVNDLDGSADLNNDGDRSDGGETDNNNTASFDVVEPRVTIDKSAVPTSSLNAGDTVTYTVVLDNLAANGATSEAFDVQFSDTIPSGLLITGITSTTTSGGASVDNPVAITGGGTGLSGQFDIPLEGSVTIVYTATIQSSILPGQSLVNDADATFSSLNGTVSGERDGSGVTEPVDNTHPDDDGILNNYGVGDDLTVTALAYEPLVQKTIVSTSEIGSTGNYVLIGEVVRYQLKFELFEGTLNDLVIQDQLPAGLLFLNDGTATFSTLNVDTSVTGVSMVARDSVIGSGTIFSDGTDIYFQLGDVVNNDNDADVEYAVIEFNALVLNTVSNQDGATRDNSFAVLYDADNNAATDPTAINTLRVDADGDGTPELTGQSASNVVTVTVREAALSFNQTIPAGTGYEAGDTFAITYTITNSGSVAAYEVNLADLVLPSEFDLTSISFNVTGTGGTVTDSTNLTTDSLAAVISQMDAGSTWTITAQVTLRDTVNPGDVYTNPADVTFTSLPGSHGSTGNITGSDTPGSAGTATGERTGADGVGGVLNDYALTDPAGLSIPVVFNVDKVADRATATIGEIVTYTVTVELIEGTTNNIILDDTLPTGMSFLAGSASLTTPAGWTINGFNANSVDQSLSSVVNPGASDSPNATATGSFSYTYQAVVLDVAGNDGITAAGDGDGQTDLINNLDARASTGNGDSGTVADNDNTATVTVIEPRVIITKSNDDVDKIVSPGQIVTYTLTLDNLGTYGSTANAYDIRVRDLLPPSLTLTVGSVVVSGATVTNNASGGNTLDLTLDHLDLGDSATITFTATVSLTPADPIDNNAKIFYDNLAADEGTAPGTGNTVFGDPDGNSGDRDYGSTGPDEAYNVNTPNEQDTDRITLGTGSIGDQVWFDLNADGNKQANEIGIAGVTVWLDYDNDGIIDGNEPSAVTDANGLYTINNLAAGTYQVSILPSSLPDGAATVNTYDLDGTGTANTTSVLLTDGQNRTDVDFGYRGTGAIGDLVWHDLDGNATQNGLELGIPGVTLDLVWDANGNGVIDAGDTVLKTVTTGANGDYLFADLLTGNYIVDVTDTDNLLANTTLTGASGVTDPEPVILTTPGENHLTADFGYRGAASLGDRVWNDRNSDGVQDAGEFGISGLTVELYRDLNNDGDAIDPGEGLVASTTTGVDGKYLFEDLIGGTYFAIVTNPPASSTPTYDLDGTGTPHQASRTLAGNTVATDVDFGYVGQASIGDYVWNDANNDGVQDNVTEPPLGGIRVYLDIDGNGAFDSATDPSAITAPDGSYLIDGLIGGTYTARVDISTVPAGYVPTYDRDGNASGNETTFILGPTQDLVDVDFGYYGNLTVSGRSYHDLDKNGAFDGSDTGLGGVTIELYNDANNNGVVDGGDFLVYSTTTASDGTYTFSTVISGDYLLVETQLAGYGSIENVSNVIDVTVAGSSITNRNFGNSTGSLAGTVFSDENDNGLQDGLEAGIAGASVTLEWSGTDGIFGSGGDDRTVTVTTDANGDYLFDQANTAGFVVHGDSTRGLLSTGSYRVLETTPAGFLDGADMAGDASGAAGTVTPGTAPNGRGADSITGIQIGTAQDATEYNFGEILPSSIAGSVHVDSGNDGVRSPGERGIPNIEITLTGNDLYGRTVILTTMSDLDGNFSFGDLYASDANGYTLTEPNQPRGYYDGLEGIGAGGVAGGIVGNDVIGNIVLTANMHVEDYTFGEIPIPPPVLVLPPTVAPLEVPEEEPGVLDNYFYNYFENFRTDEDDEEKSYLLDGPYTPPEAILPIMPLYSGHAEPGSTIVLEIRNVRGAVIGTETVLADAGGNWIAKFPSSIVYDTPTTVTQTVTRPSYANSGDENFNFRNNYSPAENPSHFFTKNYDVDEVWAQNSKEFKDMEKGLKNPQNFGWSSYNYEFLAAPGVPSS